LWLVTGNDDYYQYIRTGADNNLGYYNNIVNSRIHDIDPVNGGSLLLFMYSRTGDSRYSAAADSTLSYLKSFPRSTDGGFFHKDLPRMQVDDLYMGAPFLAEYGQIFDVQEEYEDAVRQVILMETHTRDPGTGLYYHSWYETASNASGQYFDAGCTDFFWGRGVGWVAMALVDTLDFLPAEYSGRDSVIAIFQRLARAISNVQDESSGVWWQVLDQGGRSGNFLESSCSCMFVYALAKGVRLGYIDASYQNIAADGYNGILNNFVRENSDGTITITNVCPGQAPGNTYQDYVRTPYTNGHSVGPFILAGIEMEGENPGVTPTPAATPAITPDVVSCSITGDVNGNGSVDIVDALLVARYYVGLAPGGFNQDCADVNCDGDVGIIDALIIARYYVGLIDSLEC
jgi:unsaturated rhamnogalacturonyl hydrolase